jgi:hypothetical protein
MALFTDHPVRHVLKGACMGLHDAWMPCSAPIRRHFRFGDGPYDHEIYAPLDSQVSLYFGRLEQYFNE